MSSLLRSLRFRITASFVAVIFAFILIVNYFPAQVIRRQLLSTKQTEMLAAAGTLAAALEGYSTLTADNAYTAATVLEVVRDRRVLVTDKSGLVIYDSSKISPLTGRLALFPDILSALRTRDVFRCVYSAAAFESRATVPIMRTGNPVGAVYLYDYDTENASFLTQMRRNLLQMTVAVSLLGLLFVASVLFGFSRRLGVLVRGVSSIGRGEYETKLELAGEDELAAIAHEFNDLTDRLDGLEKTRRQFVSDASHELKTPLASIKLLSDSIIQTPDIRPEDVREFLTDINDEIERLTRITESLLALTRFEANAGLRAERCDVAAVVHKCADILRGSATQYGVTVHLDLPGEFFVLAGRDSLHQIVFNLLENAIKYNRTGGEVFASLSQEEDMTLLRVRDTGIGIPPAQLPHIFKRFYRVDKARSRETGGTGLGLSIVSEFVDSMGGRLEVDSEYGVGSEFRVYFVTLREGGDA